MFITHWISRKSYEILKIINTTKEFNSFSPVLLYITWLKLSKVEIGGHCSPQDGLGLKLVCVLWVLVSPLEVIFMRSNHRKPVKLKHMGKMIFLEAAVCYWLCLASNYALAFIRVFDPSMDSDSVVQALLDKTHEY